MARILARCILVPLLAVMAMPLILALTAPLFLAIFLSPRSIPPCAGGLHDIRDEPQAALYGKYLVLRDASLWREVGFQSERDVFSTMADRPDCCRAERLSSNLNAQKLWSGGASLKGPSGSTLYLHFEFNRCGTIIEQYRTVLAQ